MALFGPLAMSDLGPALPASGIAVIAGLATLRPSGPIAMTNGVEVSTIPSRARAGTPRHLGAAPSPGRLRHRLEQIPQS